MRDEEPRRRPAGREVIAVDPHLSTRWLSHDYPDPVARWNHHPEYEVHLIRHGTGRYIVGDAVGTFEAGQLVLVGPDVPHNWVSDLGPGEKLEKRDVVLQFHDYWVRQCQIVIPELTSLNPLLTNSVRGVEFCGESALRGAAALERIGTATGSERAVETFSLLHIMANAPEQERRYLSTPWMSTISRKEHLTVVNDSLEYIFDNITGEVMLSAAARISGMSDSTFSRYFKKASGQTFSAMVRRLRIAHACKLLETTGDSISDIAQAVGYGNLSNFNRQFLKDRGSTPRAYRRQFSDEAR